VREFGDVVTRLKLPSTNNQTSTPAVQRAGFIGDNMNNTGAQETQEEQSATYDELFSWFTESLT
jgi:hypothetical protein